MGIGEKLFMFDKVTERDLFRSLRPRGPHERRSLSERVDCRSRLEALSFFSGKPPALPGLPLPPA